MATDYYPATDDTAESAPAAPDTEGTAGEQNPESDTEDLGGTFTVQKSVFGDRNIQPKDRIVIEAVHIYDDEIAFRSISESKEEETEPKGMNANEEIDMMAGMPKKGMM